MKKMILVLMLLGAVSSPKAQTFEEWFRQKKTQIKYLVTQISALKVYGSAIEKGYAIAEEGLTSIGNSKGSDLDQHKHYFTSLQKVNPAIKSHAKTHALIFLQETILLLCQRLKNSKRMTQFTPPENAYYHSVAAKILGECKEMTEQLRLLITDDNYQMKDDERIKRIEWLYTATVDQYVFIRQFFANVQLLALQRLKDGNDVHVAEAGYGVEK